MTLKRYDIGINYVYSEEGSHAVTEKFFRDSGEHCSHADALAYAEQRVAEAVKKADEEMLRVKACEHIAEGDEGWEKLRNICPSTMAVATLRDELAAKEAEIERLMKKITDDAHEDDALLAAKEAEIDRLKADNLLHRQTANGEYWTWQGDGSDHLESLVCPVLIRANDLAALRAAKAKLLGALKVSVSNCACLSDCPMCRSGLEAIADAERTVTGD